MLKYLFSSILFLGITTSAAAQRKDSINYYLPDFVKTKIADYLDKEIKQKDIEHYILLSHHNDTTYVLVSGYNLNSNKLIYILNNNNRYLKVKSNLTLPLLTFEDLLFSEILHKVKKPSTEYEIIEHTDINPAGYWIIFKGKYSDAKLIRTEHTRY